MWKQRNELTTIWNFSITQIIFKITCKFKKAFYMETKFTIHKKLTGKLSASYNLITFKKSTKFVMGNSSIRHNLLQPTK